VCGEFDDDVDGDRPARARRDVVHDLRQVDGVCDRAVVFEKPLGLRPVVVRRDEQQSVRAGVGGPPRQRERLGGVVRSRPRDDGDVVDGVANRLDDLDVLVVCHGGRLAGGAGRDHPVDARPLENPSVLGELCVVDLVLVGERRRHRGVDAFERLVGRFAVGALVVGRVRGRCRGVRHGVSGWSSVRTVARGSGVVRDGVATPACGRVTRVSSRRAASLPASAIRASTRFESHRRYDRPVYIRCVSARRGPSRLRPVDDRLGLLLEGAGDGGEPNGEAVAAGTRPPVEVDLTVWRVTPARPLGGLDSRP